MDKTLHVLFEEQVQKIPENTAALFKNQKLTYRELNEKSNSIAHLLRKKGISSDKIVPVIMERSLTMMIGLMAVLKSGGAYLPISPETPANRLNLMIKDCRTTLVLTQGKFSHQIGNHLDQEVEIIDLDAEELYNENHNNLPPINKPHHLAYVIYTSGSTGKPKGVMIQHRSIINRLLWMQKRYPIGEKDIILQKTPFFFDVSVWELFWWSITGAAVCFLLPGFEKFPQAIIETVATRNITVMHFVPSMMAAFLGYLENSGDTERLSPLKRVFASGEALKPTHVEIFSRTLHKKNKTQLTNLYGPTEATVDVSYYDIPMDKIDPGQYGQSIPIGKPIDNINLYIINKKMDEQPVEVEGELSIGGIGVARGYLNNPELTAEKFHHWHPSSFFRESPSFYKKSLQNHTAIYRTGDLARTLPDGNIEFLGRLDFQVKIRGLRIELGEIEAVLASHPSIQDCAVLVKETTETIITLEAFMVTKEEINTEDLKKYLSSFLPEYMIPTKFIAMNSLPLTPSGKVDRHQLKS